MVRRSGVEVPAVSRIDVTKMLVVAHKICGVCRVMVRPLHGHGIEPEWGASRVGLLNRLFTQHTHGFDAGLRHGWSG